MNKSFLTLLLFIYSFYSCQENINKDLQKLCFNPINFPQKASITFNGKDSIFNDYFECSVKLIVYIDSSMCSLCNVSKMQEWKPIIEYSKLMNEELKIYFIFCNPVKNKNSLRLALSSNPINYPVLIDEKGDFERLNPHLPKNKILHTFLLDENNKVILVGNPLHNKEIEKLFYKKTQELLAK